MAAQILRSETYVTGLVAQDQVNRIAKCGRLAVAPQLLKLRQRQTLDKHLTDQQFPVPGRFLESPLDQRFQSRARRMDMAHRLTQIARKEFHMPGLVVHLRAGEQLRLHVGQQLYQLR